MELGAHMGFTKITDSFVPRDIRLFVPASTFGEFGNILAPRVQVFVIFVILLNTTTMFSMHTPVSIFPLG